MSKYGLDAERGAMAVIGFAALVVIGAVAFGVQTGSVVAGTSNPMVMDSCSIDSTGGSCTGPNPVYFPYNGYVTTSSSDPLVFWVQTTGAETSNLDTSKANCSFSVDDLGPGKNGGHFSVGEFDDEGTNSADVSSVINPVTVDSKDMQVKNGEIMCKFSFNEIWKQGSKHTDGQDLKYIEGFSTLSMHNPQLSVDVQQDDPVEPPAPPPPPVELFVNFLQGILDTIF